jgi:hypothetical protein
MKANSQSLNQEILSIEREQDKCESLMNFQNKIDVQNLIRYLQENIVGHFQVEIYKHETA